MSSLADEVNSLLSFHETIKYIADTYNLFSVAGVFLLSSKSTKLPNLNGPASV